MKSYLCKLVLAFLFLLMIINAFPGFASNIAFRSVFAASVRTSKNGQDFIKIHEADSGYHEYAYDDGYGTWTIGWGHTSGVTKGMHITEAQAQAFFEQDLLKKEKIVTAYEDKEGIIFTQQQFDALVSLVFNLSTNPLGKNDYRLTKAIKKYQNGSNVNIPKEKVWECFATWHHANDVDVNGLFYRRLNEAVMFSYGEYTRKLNWKIPNWLKNNQKGDDVPNGWIPEEYLGASGPTGITMSPSSVDKIAGDIQNLSIKYEPSNTTDKTLTWTSSNITIATVSSTGTGKAKVITKKAGTVTITAKTSNGKTAKCIITVKAATTVPLSNTALISNGSYIIKKADSDFSVCVKENSHSAGEVVHMWEFNKTNKYQKWKFTHKGNGYYSVINEGSGLALEVAGGSTESRTGLQQNTYNGTNAQLWQPVQNAYGSYWLVPKCATNRVMHVNGNYKENGTRIETMACDQNSNAQRFVLYSAPTVISLNQTTLTRVVGETYTLKATITPSYASNKAVNWKSSDSSIVKVDSNGKLKALKVGTATITATAADGGKTATCKVTVKAADNLTKSSVQTIANGIYRIRMSGSSYSLAVQGGSNEKGANICIMQDAEGDYYQQFRFEYVSNGYYKVTSVGSGMCLDDNNRGTEPGANIHQWTPKEGEPAQLWQPVKKGSYYYLTPQCAPGLVADVEYAEKTNGTNVSLWVPKGGAHQLFELIPVRVITGVAVDPEEMTLVIDETQTVNAVITPSAAKDKTVIWSSSDPQTATVNGNGKVTGMEAGTAVITATTIDGGLKAACTVTVEDQPTLILGTQQTVEEGIYWIKMSKESPVLTTEGNGSSSAGAEIQIWEKDRENLFQQFKLLYIGEGYYNIQNVGSGLALEVGAANNYTGAKIVQNTVDTGKDVQLWQIVPSPAGDGYFYLIPKCSANLTMAVHVGSTVNGTYIVLWNPKAFSHYKFDFVPVKMEMDEADFSLPEGQTVIGEEAFAGLPMSVVKCSDGLLEIGSRAFSDCKNLKEIYIPDTTISIAEDAFEDCGRITIWGRNGSLAEKYAKEKGYAFEPLS